MSMKLSNSFKPVRYSVLIEIDDNVTKNSYSDGANVSNRELAIQMLKKAINHLETTLDN